MSTSAAQDAPDTGWHPLGPVREPEKRTWPPQVVRNDVETRLMAFRADMSFCENNKDLSPQDVLELLSEDRWSAEYHIKGRRDDVVYEQKLAHCMAILSPLPTKTLLSMFIERRFQYDHDYCRHDDGDNGVVMTEAIKDTLRTLLNTREHVSRPGDRKARQKAAKARQNPTKQRPVKTRCGRKA